MQSARHRGDARLATYLVGYALAVLLTVIAFGVVRTQLLTPMSTMAVIAVAGLVQIVVHLRCFLHLDFSSAARDKLVALGFTVILVGILMGGSLWILFDLHRRMAGAG
jgi:cytochrome o ubiquinol oxidase operon protein cyoD